MPVSELRLWDYKHELIQVPLKHLTLIQVGLEWREARQVFQEDFRKNTSRVWVGTVQEFRLSQKKISRSRAGMSSCSPGQL